MTTDEPHSASVMVEKQERNELVESLLGVRRFGPPPFLVRNLKYVKEQKEEVSNKIWDLNWVSNPFRGHQKVRQLTLSCVLRLCTLPDIVHRRFTQRTSGASGNGVATCRVRLWLSVITTMGENIAFGVREGVVRLWTKTQVDGGALIEDLNVVHNFDISGILAFLEAYPSRVSIVIELYANKTRTQPVEDVPILRGEQCLLDSEIADASSVPNKDFVVHLYNSTKQRAAAKQPKMGMSPKTGSKTQSDAVTAANLSNHGHIEADSVSDDENPNKQLYAFENNPSMTTHNSRGTVTFSLSGVLRNMQPNELGEGVFSKHILIECHYTAPGFPWWEGIIRHDFICPWCHRNCRRLRTLLFHFQLDHDRAELALEAVQEPGDSETNSEPSFILNFNITPVEGRQRQSNRDRPDKNVPGLNKTPDIPDENVMVNRRRFSRYPCDSGDDTDELDMSKCRVSGKGDASDASSDTTQYDDIPATSIGNLGWGKCKACGRSHHRMYRHDLNYCSEWCEIAHKSKVQIDSGEGNTSGDETQKNYKPLSTLELASRRRRINFKDTLGDKVLYHVVSLSPFLEEHFDEDGADSEDDIDHSWRFRIVEDKLAALEGTFPKNRVLWTMWNRYAFENYPAPGAYAERYSRYACEMFVFEYGSEIHRLNLRLHLCAFLRILHIHGCIDSEGFKSVMLCLDGNKKRRQCAISARPEATPIPDPKFSKTRKTKNRTRKKN